MLSTINKWFCASDKYDKESLIRKCLLILELVYDMECMCIQDIKICACMQRHTASEVHCVAQCLEVSFRWASMIRINFLLIYLFIHVL